MDASEQLTQIYQYTVGLFKAAPGGYLAGLADFVDAGNTPQDMALALAGSPAFKALYPDARTIAGQDFNSDDDFATLFLANLLGSTVSDANMAVAKTWMVEQLAAGTSRAAIAVTAIDLIAGVDATNTDWYPAKQQLDARVDLAEGYQLMGGADELDIADLQNVLDPAGINLNIDSVMAAGANVLRLTGDQAVRVDFTSRSNQITGIDLDGDGAVENNGSENAISGMASDYDIIDAYARNPLNTFDKVQNFLGNISYDGTGFGGDGVNTDGNIFLGGLGADTARAGIGNDFLTGGGVAGTGVDALYGGRNADFFFASLSDLSTTDGDSLQISGGQTTDDSAVVGDTAMDSDWLLLEVADDEDGTVVNLNNGNDLTGHGDGTSTDLPGGQFVLTGDSGAWVWMTEIENVDASGNLYGFLDDVDVALGENGRLVGDENVGIGATSQLNIIGSGADNIFIGGFDNDRLQGFAGNDLLFGGNLRYNNNPNTLDIVNDGVDELFGGAGDDNLVFEADGGIYEGDNTQDADGGKSDTLWLTNQAMGTQTAAALIADSTLRFDLAAGLVGGLDNAAGYGGADAAPDATGAFTADQSNYADGVSRGAVQDMENVIATGLGSVDYLAAGTNDPELLFNNQQNHFAYNGDLDLRGTAGANTLYASGGNDVIEGRQGNDLLSGGNSSDTFIFSLGTNVGDGVDVIHRQLDADGDNIWDGGFGVDFNTNDVPADSDKSLFVTINEQDNAGVDNGNGIENIRVNFVTFKISTGDEITFTGQGMADARTYPELLVSITNAIAADYAGQFTATWEGGASRTIEIKATDPSVGFTANDAVVSAQLEIQGGNIDVNSEISTLVIQPDTTPDLLVYASYEDRADGELVDDDATTGSAISLGLDSYAEDLVIDFAADGTRIAEDQAYTLTFNNLTTEDTLTIMVNGVKYSLIVGVDLDGNEIANEELLTQGGTAANQAIIQANFLTRMNAFINSFMDDDTAAGQVSSAFAGSTLTLTQAVYNGEETVFMRTPTATILNGSTGELASVVIANTAQHEVHLLDFDGRNGLLNQDNVLFVGNSGYDNSRAVLETGAGAAGTANTMNSSEAVVVDGGSNTLKATVFGTTRAIADNTATNSFLATDFTVHGDDLLLTGLANDTVNAGTGDDRVLGSLGTDIIDGGKSYYAVRVLGEAQARVYVLNQWEATNSSNAASPLSGLTIASINRIGDAETGNAAPNNVGLAEVYNDTLQFQQADFNADSKFTVTLNNFSGSTPSTVEFRNGGAGTVGVDNGGDGTIDTTTTFTNFENIRTVSGTGNAVANDGQGNDTLNVSALSTAAGGISYDLTNLATAGDVRYSADAHANLTVPVQADYESLVIKVDGVESVIAGLGDDLLVIDETEAAKNNSFIGTQGDDRIDYRNDFGSIIAEPTLTIKVDNVAAVSSATTGTDTVTMTNGRVGSTLAVDTLGQIERIALNGNTAQSSAEADVLDVTALTSGATVDYINGEVRVGSTVHLTIENMVQIENVWADGNDLVIVADAETMNNNTRSDEGVDNTPAEDILFMTYLDFDDLNAGTTTRTGFASQVANNTITQVINQGQFTFSLSEVGTDADVDRVDYSAETGRIIAAVGQGTDTAPQYIIVDGDGAVNLADAGSRIDALQDVEEIVASLGESVLDFTTVNADRQITFTYVDPAVNPVNNANFESTIRIADGAGNVIDSLNGFVEQYVYNTVVNNVDDATWNRIEGGDLDEVIIYEGSEDLVNQAGLDHRFTNDTLTLRGGDNEVRYSPLETSVTVAIAVVEEDTATAGAAEGLITATVNFQDGIGGALGGGGTHTITSYTSDNSISAGGSLKIEGSQDAEDIVGFTSLSNKAFVLGGSPGVVRVNIGALESIVLTGFEFLQDQNTDDVYDFASLAATSGLSLLDNGADHDTVKVVNDAVNFNASGANTIDLDNLGATAGGFNFDFDVMDVTGVTLSNLILNGGTNALPLNADTDNTDEVVLGVLSRVTTINDFETMVLTNASVAAGSVFTFNAATNTLTQGSTSISTTADVLSFGGLVREVPAAGFGNSSVDDVTTGVTVTVAGATGAEVHGGAGADTLNGSDGADILRGGAGNDTLNGGVSSETRQIQLSGALDNDASSSTVTLTLTGTAPTTVVLTEGTEIVEGAGSIAIGNALALAVNTNLAAINTAAAWTNGSLTGASFDGALLTFTFTSGADVLDTETIAITSIDASFGATFVVSAETISVQGGGAGADTYVFAATAAANGVDTIVNFDLSDTLNFDALLTNAAALNVAVDNTSVAAANIDNDVQLFDNLGTALTATTLAAEFAGAGFAFSSVAGDVAVVLEIDSTSVAEDVNVWYVSDANNDGTIAVSEVALVGIVSAAGDLAFALGNF